MQSSHTVQRWLKALGFLGAQKTHIPHTVGMGFLSQAVQCLDLLRVGGHYEFAKAAVCNTAFLCVGIEHVSPLHTQLSFERALRVINARMNDLAVARAGTRANRVVGLQHQPLARMTGRGQHACTRCGQTHHACTNHHTIDSVHNLPLQKQDCGRKKTASEDAVFGRLETN